MFFYCGNEGGAGLFLGFKNKRVTEGGELKENHPTQFASVYFTKKWTAFRLAV